MSWHGAFSEAALNTKPPQAAPASVHNHRGPMMDTKSCEDSKENNLKNPIWRRDEIHQKRESWPSNIDLPLSLRSVATLVPVASRRLVPISVALHGALDSHAD